MTDHLSDEGVTVPMPARTVVADQAGATLLTVAGVLLLPLGSRIELGGDVPDATVVGIRLVDADVGAPSLVLDVDAGGSSFDRAALREAGAELEVVEAAEHIASGAEPEGTAAAPVEGTGPTKTTPEPA